MPYKVLGSQDLADEYDDHSDKNHLETAFNALEEQGWTLVNILPGFVMVDESEEAEKRGGTSLFHVLPEFIFHRD